MINAPRALVDILLGLAWIVGVGTGITVVYQHAFVAGMAATAPLEWPSESRIRPIPGRATLVMLAHPKCPCTRASLGELDRLLAACGGRVSAHVAFFRPMGESDDWARTDTVAEAKGIPGVSVTIDEGGSEASLFAAATSGQVVLYDGRGRLVFSGGITPGRGHSGDSVGSFALEEILLGIAAPSGVERSDVFGCGLFGPDDVPRPRCEKGEAPR